MFDHFNFLSTGVTNLRSLSRNLALQAQEVKSRQKDILTGRHNQKEAAIYPEGSVSPGSSDGHSAQFYMMMMTTPAQFIKNNKEGLKRKSVRR